MRLYRPSLSLTRSDLPLRRPNPGRPAIILVPSQGTPTHTWRALTLLLTREGYETRTVDVSPSLAPSSSSRRLLPRPSPSGGTSSRSGSSSTFLSPAALAIRRVLESLIVSSEREVVLVLHGRSSSAGLEAASGLGTLERRADGEPGGIVRFVFVAAGALYPGGVGAFMPLACELTPSSFAVTLLDAVVPAATQRRLAGQVGEAVERRRRMGGFAVDPAVGAGMGASVDVREVNAGHDVAASAPGVLARVVGECVELGGW